MMSFNYFIHKYKLKNKATSIIKIQQVLPSLTLNHVGIYLRGRAFSTNIGIVTIIPSKRTHWICYIINQYFDSYGVVYPKKLSKFLMNQNRRCL